MIRLFLLSLGLTITACAPAPETIAPTPVSEVPYRSWSCDQLSAERQRLAAELTVASRLQMQAYSSDRISVGYTGLPLATIRGEDLSHQIGLNKGQQEAIHRASITNGCPELTRIAPRS